MRPEGAGGDQYVPVHLFVFRGSFSATSLSLGDCARLEHCDLWSGFDARNSPPCTRSHASIGTQRDDPGGECTAVILNESCRTSSNSTTMTRSATFCVVPCKRMASKVIC